MTRAKYAVYRIGDDGSLTPHSELTLPHNPGELPTDIDVRDHIEQCASEFPEGKYRLIPTFTVWDFSTRTEVHWP